ncbi:MAG TPA: hypothetical protein VL752_14415 [Acidisoma sp.]|uniref:hypothetical protein n=1 Tax=Acidisoma sp. TaxID=1872115 RepID=UPI002B509C8E|nr:hypothetical protein [Acidisoma sp.]HTI02139.1 hypothetical protein [Acidisoma sp.]
MTLTTNHCRRAGPRIGGRSLVRTALSGALLTGIALPAMAADYPSVQPQRDVTVSYDLDSSATGPMRLRLMASPQMQIMRIELGGNGDYLLLDQGQERARLVSPQKGLDFAVPTEGFLHRDLGPASGLRFQRDGHRRIAGLSCTVWKVLGPDGAGDACVTEDGVVLEGQGRGFRPDDQGRVPAGHLIATAVDYAPLPPALFVVPPGLQEVDLPQALFRAMVPGLSGLPAP